MTRPTEMSRSTKTVLKWRIRESPLLDFSKIPVAGPQPLGSVETEVNGGTCGVRVKYMRRLRTHE